MFGEVAFFVVVALTGCALTWTCDVARPVRLALALLGGVAAFAIATVAGVIVGVPTSLPLVALVLLVGAAASVALQRRPRSALTRYGLDAFVLVAFCSLAVIATRALEPGRSTRDSYDYTQIAGLLANGHGRLVSFHLLRTRLLGYPAMNLAAFSDGRVHLTALAVVVGTAVLVVLGFLVADHLGGTLTPTQSRSVAVLGVAALVTSYHFVFELFYVNSHLAMGGFVLVALVPSALACTSPALARAATPIAALCAAVIPLVRPEGGLLAILIVVASLGHQRVVPRIRVVAISVAVTTAAWNLHLLRVGIASDATSSQTVQPAATIVLVVALVVVAEWTRRRPSAVRVLQRSVEFGLWGGLSLLAIIDTNTVTSSIDAFYRNVFRGAGTWGPMMAALVVGFVASQAMLRFPPMSSPAFVVRTFFPLMFALAPIRDAAYRVGTGDSLNRSLTHVLPIAVLAVLTTTALGQPRIRRRSAPVKEPVAT